MTDPFYAAIARFNELYRLPAPPEPTALGAARVRSFHDILSEEVAEGLDLAARYEAAEAAGTAGKDGAATLDLMTELSDWLGDLVVYCASEAKRWGLPLPEILAVIMESNFSKLGADGLPLYDARGKVMKGPDYWRPEPRLRALLTDRQGATATPVEPARCPTPASRAGHDWADEGAPADA